VPKLYACNPIKKDVHFGEKTVLAMMNAYVLFVVSKSTALCLCIGDGSIKGFYEG
jgi:hypothetical protein